MTQTENDYYEINYKSIVHQKDLRVTSYRYPSHKIKYITHGLSMSNLKKYYFIVDWQLTMEENLNNESLWI